MHTEIMPNIFRIEVPLPKNPLRFLNSYLIRGEERSLLIDTGFQQEECRVALHSALDEIGVSIEDIDVFGTHIHSDHIGLAPEFIGENGKIFLGAGDFHWTTNEENDRYWALMDEVFLGEGFPREELDQLVSLNPARNYGPELDLPAYTVVHDGDKFQIAGYTLEVIDASGHTPGMVCLWMEKEQVMFTADHILFDITPNITMWPNLENSLGVYLKNLEKFKKFPVKKSLPGHRHEGNYLERIDSIIAHHEHRVGETLDIVKNKPGMHTYDIAGKMTWAIRAKNWEEFPVIQKWFAIGEALAHLEYLISLGKVERRHENGINTYYPV